VRKRGSGILTHVTTLPSPFGIGDMGPWAYRFADFLSQARQRYWQILPMNLPNPAWGSSPYSCLSAFAGNIYLISPEQMRKEGYLEDDDIGPVPPFELSRIEYGRVYPYKDELFEKAWARFREKGVRQSEFSDFCESRSDWLDDFALFICIKEKFGGRAWNEWPPEIMDRDPEALEAVKGKLSDKIEKVKFLQYLFFDQWGALKRHANGGGIHIIGDIPIYTNFDSADVWTNPELFKLDRDRRPAFKAGVPPDYFSETGQLWGNPVYRWDVMKEEGYDWWVQRMRNNLELFDVIRIDHFRGFLAYWEVAAGEKTAVNGRWVEGPGEDFFNTLLRHFPGLPIVAEDLGTITPDVMELIRRFDFPGMRVLLFAFGDDFPENPYLLHNHERNCMATTGTHDTNTVRGWFEKEATKEQRKRVCEYFGFEIDAESAPREFVRIIMMSVADMAIFPMQDILGLGDDARLNRPATTRGNWEWRLAPEQITPALAEYLAEITELYGRA
jgi:4-alpha-glucanotransferase